MLDNSQAAPSGAAFFVFRSGMRKFSHPDWATNRKFFRVRWEVDNVSDVTYVHDVVYARELERFDSRFFHKNTQIRRTFRDNSGGLIKDNVTQAGLETTVTTHWLRLDSGEYRGVTDYHKGPKGSEHANLAVLPERYFTHLENGSIQRDKYGYELTTRLRLAVVLGLDTDMTRPTMSFQGYGGFQGVQPGNIDKYATIPEARAVSEFYLTQPFEFVERLLCGEGGAWAEATKRTNIEHAEAVDRICGVVLGVLCDEAANML